MNLLLDFQLLVILNLFVLLLWPVTTPYTTNRRDAVSIIMLGLTILVILGDIYYLVLKSTGHA